MNSVDVIPRFPRSCVSRICYNSDMKTISAFAAAILLSGCLSSSPRSATLWNLDYRNVASTESAAVYGPARLLQVSVSSPSDNRSMLVRRADGSVAFDPYHEYAASPALLLRNVASEAMARSGVFASVVGSASSAQTDCSVEIVFTKLALDCSQEGRREAEVELVLRVVRKGAIEHIVRGGGRVDAQSGKYGKAFSEAASQALVDALAKLR